MCERFWTLPAPLQPIGKLCLDPHEVQDHREFSCQGDLYSFRAAPLGDVHPQRLSFENRAIRDSRTLAASYSAVRTISSPVRVIPPVTSFSPDWYFFGVSPNSAPAAFDFAMRLGSSIADL